MKNLKKISFGVFAFFFGLALILTQSAFKAATPGAFNRLSTTFYYHGPDYSEEEVTKESNWTTEEPEESCDNVDEAPCSINIDDTYVDGSGNLDSSADLRADLNSPTSTYYISGSDDSLMTFVNKSE